MKRFGRRLRAELVAGWVSSRRSAGSNRVRREPYRMRGAAAGSPCAWLAMRCETDRTPSSPGRTPCRRTSPNKFKEAVFGFAAGAVTRLDPERAVRPGTRVRCTTGTPRRACTASRPSGFSSTTRSDPDRVDRDPSHRRSPRGRADRLPFAWPSGIGSGRAPGEVEAWLEPPRAARHATWRSMSSRGQYPIRRRPRPSVWAGQIEDEKLRRRRTLRYSREWFVQDPEAARIVARRGGRSPGVAAADPGQLAAEQSRRSRAKNTESDG